MFARRYFAGRYFAPRYFPQSKGQVVAAKFGRIEVTVSRSIIGYRVDPSRLEVTPQPQQMDYQGRQ